MFKRVLIPTDGSQYSMGAVEKGLRLAKETGAEVTALYVVDNRSFSHYPRDCDVDSACMMLREEGEKAVEVVRRMGEEMGLPVTTRIEEGSPGWVISELSGEYDLVVMATLGRTGISRILLGSVAEHVARHAKSPVMLVKVHRD